MSSRKISQNAISDEKIELLIADILLCGVAIAALIVAVGGGLYLFRHGMESHNYNQFVGEPRDLCTISGIFADVLALKARGIIQLGLIVLVATPISRVAFALFAFAKQRDRIYLVITTVVLGILCYGLLGS